VIAWWAYGYGASYLFGKPQELVVSLIGYFDESGHPGKPGRPDSNVHCFVIAGLIAECQDWLDFDQAWSAILRDEGLPWFHLKELKGAVRKKRSGWTSTRLASLICKLEDVISEASIASLVANTMIYRPGRRRDAVGQEYLKRHRQVILNSLQTLRSQGLPREGQRVHFVFARHQEVNPRRSHEQLQEELLSDDLFYREHGGYLGDLTLARPEDKTPLQAADLVAGQIYAQYREGGVQPRLIREFPVRWYLTAHPFSGL